MIDILLGVIILALLVKSYFDEQSNKRERENLTKAFMAKTLQEYTQSKIMEDTEPQEEKVIDELPMESVDESIFEKHLRNITQSDGE